MTAETIRDDAQVVILMGSKSDLPHAEAIAKALREFGVGCAMRVASAHKVTRHLLDLLTAYDAADAPRVFITIAGRSNVRIFSISGDPFTGGYAFQSNPGLGVTASNTVYEFDMYLPDSASASEAIEAELQQTHAGLLYNMAWQFRYDGLPTDVMELHIFNYFGNQSGTCAGDCWEYSGITVPRFTPNTWYHIRAHFTISGGSVTHDWIELTPEGSSTTRYLPTQNNVHQAFDIHPDLDDTFDNALQLDLNSTGTAYSVYFDHVNAGYNQP